jgi:hypothetical protein
MKVVELKEASSSRGDAVVDPLQRDFERGLCFAHVMMSINQLKGREGAICARAMAELLVSKGIVEQEELEAKKKTHQTSWIWLW